MKKMPWLNKMSFEHLFLLLYSFFIMLFFTQSSPLFVQNLWVDPNAFFTVGKGMLHGLVPYRDLFEQKGPLLYGLHAIAAFISGTTFEGVYLLEGLALFVTLLCAFKLARLYLELIPAYGVTLFLPLFILNDKIFLFGDSAEEFSMPFMLIFLYMMLKHFKNHPGSAFNRPFYLVNGILAGCVLWMKFTIIGPWLGFYFALFIIAIGKKAWRDLGNAIVFTFAGLVLSSIPWLLYFAAHHALKDLFDVYFKFNLVTYSSKASLPVKLVNATLTFGQSFNTILEIKIMMIIGLIDFLFTWKYLQTKNQKWLLVSTVFFLILGVYIGGKNFIYYYEIITPLALFGLISVGYYLQRSLNAKMETLNKMNWLTTSAIALTAFVLCFGFNSNIRFSKLYKRTPLPHQTFAKIMHKEPHPTLLNYGFLDGGFYLAADIVPNIRYFENQNINPKSYPENVLEQNRYIKEGKVQFVVVRLFPPQQPVRIPYIFNHYRIVAFQDHGLGPGSTYRYLLFKKVR